MSKLSIRLLLVLSIISLVSFLIIPSKTLALARVGYESSDIATFSSTTPPTSSCSRQNLFGIFVPWYEYLKLTPQPVLGGGSTTVCSVQSDFSLSSLNDIWLIGFAIFDDLLRLAGFVAVIFVIYGGVRYITSQGEPNNTKAAQSTIINALIGLAIAAIAATAVSFIASSLGG